MGTFRTAVSYTGSAHARTRAWKWVSHVGEDFEDHEPESAVFKVIWRAYVWLHKETQ